MIDLNANPEIWDMRYDVFVSSSSMFRCDNNAKLDLSLYLPPAPGLSHMHVDCRIISGKSKLLLQLTALGLIGVHGDPAVKHADQAPRHQ